MEVHFMMSTQEFLSRVITARPSWKRSAQGGGAGVRRASAIASGARLSAFRPAIGQLRPLRYTATLLDLWQCGAAEWGGIGAAVAGGDQLGGTDDWQRRPQRTPECGPDGDPVAKVAAHQMRLNTERQASYRMPLDPLKIL
ncbi:unnamed protein product, partial [Iphiclides podalirius]